jgi:hypothetical protein
MEAKLQQQLAWAEQEPLYQIYLDLQKAYDALDWGRCLEILAGYGVGPNLLCLQEQFWDDAKMVCCAGGNYGEPFGAYQGVTQGGPLSSLIFNVCIDCVIWEWLHQVMGDDVAREGVGDAVRDQCINFFVDDGSVSARCPVWLQSSFDILTQLFERIGLLANANKMKVMICMPGKIQVAPTETEYASQRVGNTTTMKYCRVDCDVCGASLAAESLRSHLETQHDIFGRSYSTKTLPLHALQRSTVLSKRLTPASTVARYFCVQANQAPGLIYADIFSCNILRISCASLPRAPNPCHDANAVDCRCWWRTQMGVTIAQSCAREDGRDGVNMRPPRVPSKPSTMYSHVMGISWTGWRFSSTWDGSSRMMISTPRPCDQI